MRKSKAKKRFYTPDPKFNDPLVSRFVNMLMLDGKKNTATNIFHDAIDLAEKTLGASGYEAWKAALANIMPTLEVKSRRIGGANFQIPMEVRPDRKISVGMKWLILYSRKRNGRTMADKLAAEIVSASKGEGAAVKKREDTHKMAEANKAFAHFRM